MHATRFLVCMDMERVIKMKFETTLIVKKLLVQLALKLKTIVSVTVLPILKTSLLFVNSLYHFLY